jgi:hypothetical protein
VAAIAQFRSLVLAAGNFIRVFPANPGTRFAQTLDLRAEKLCEIGRCCGGSLHWLLQSQARFYKQYRKGFLEVIV